jgi:predicted transcriptional regulator
MNKEEVEDLKGEYACGILEGKHQHQTIDQFGIDYMRKVCDLRNGNKRPIFEQLRDIEHSQSEIGIKYDAKSSFLNCLRLLRYYGHNDGIIADLFNVDRSYVSQIVSSPRKHLKYVGLKSITSEMSKIKSTFRKRAVYFKELIRDLKNQIRELKQKLAKPPKEICELIITDDFNIEFLKKKISIGLKDKGYKQNQIAKIMGISERSVRNYLRKARMSYEKEGE